MNFGTLKYLLLAVTLTGAAALPLQSQRASAAADKSPADELPSYITRVTHFGERGDWSHDGKKLLFLERTFGDVFEVEVATKTIRSVSHHYSHEGYTRALYLSNGDILLSGARKFNAEDPGPSRWRDPELWVLSKDLDKPPVPLGTRCSEGPAVSRTRPTIAWTVSHRNYPDRLPEGVSQMWMGDIKYDGGVPRLANVRLVLDNRDLPFRSGLETQNFRPPDEKELIFSAYGYEGTEVIGIHLETGKITNYSNSPHYEEPEGILPDGQYTLVEADRHNPKGSQYIDVYRLKLDGSGEMFRVSRFGDYPGYKASNPVVSDDGRFIEFQEARIGDPAGFGRGLFIYDIEKAKAADVWKQEEK